MQPGRGHVSVANGVREPIVETGDLGPLCGAQKVNSFNRTLVGVYALAKRFGGVFFDDQGVFVTSSPEAKKLQMTKIGDATASRLYSFDLTALEQHVQETKCASGICHDERVALQHVGAHKLLLVSLDVQAEATRVWRE